jgi:hypothetical protein
MQLCECLLSKAHWQQKRRCPCHPRRYAVRMPFRLSRLPGPPAFSNRLVYFFLPLTLFFFLVTQANSAYGMQSDKIVKVELDYLDFIPKPGQTPISFSTCLLSQLLPELKNPRFMYFNDIGEDWWKQKFLDGGFTFVLANDFNKDGIADVVFVGEYESGENSEINSFLTIVSLRYKTATRELLITAPIPTKAIWLRLAPRYTPGIDAIFLLLDGVDENDEMVIYWDGKKYVAPWAKGPDLFEQGKSGSLPSQKEDCKKKSKR